MIKKLFNLVSSLKLTVVTLTMAMVLVFVGTLAQVELGLYEAQNRFFRSFFVYWSPESAGWKIPVLPGGWLLGWVLLINLLAAHFKRFAINRKKIGIFLIHAGLIFLLLGQFLTEVFQVESAMEIAEGESKNYSVSDRRNELVIIDRSSPETDKVISVPESLVARKEDLRHAELPFTVRIKQYHENSNLSREGSPAATQGVGTKLSLTGARPVTSMDFRNVPSAVVEIVTPEKSLGTWLLSSHLDEKQEIEYKGKTYQLAMRFQRFYKPYSIQLIDFRHDRYQGTDIPKNYSSEIRLRNPETGEDRVQLIYMNNPLRYGGETYYQASFRGPTVTVLQVVRNPAWITPYVACTLVGGGLLLHFFMHLFAFLKRRRQGVSNSRPQPSAGPELASAATASPTSTKRRNS